LAMGDLHDLHEARPDLAYSAFHGFGGAAIPPCRPATARRPPRHLPPDPRANRGGARLQADSSVGAEVGGLRCLCGKPPFSRVRPMPAAGAYLTFFYLSISHPYKCTYIFVISLHTKRHICHFC
jgi:hypothetical protein